MNNHYKFEPRKLNLYQSEMMQEKSSFTNNSRNSFSGSYLLSCKDSTVGRMNNKINSLYSNIENGYSNICSWLNDFCSDVNNIENALEKCNPTDIKSSELSGFLNSLSNIDIFFDIKESSNSIVDIIKKITPSSGKDYEDIYESADSDSAYMRKMIDYFGEANVERTEEYNGMTFVYLKNGVVIEIKDGEFNDAYINNDLSIRFDKLEDIKKIKSITKTGTSSSNEIINYYKIELDNGFEYEIDSKTKSCTKIKYNGELVFNRIPKRMTEAGFTIFNLESVKRENGYTKIITDRNLNYCFDSTGYFKNIYTVCNGQEHDITNLLNSPNIDITKITNVKIAPFFNTISYEFEDGSELEYDLNGNLIKKIFDGEEYTQEDMLYEFVREIAHKYNKSEEWAAYYLSAINNKALDSSLKEDESKFINLVDKIYNEDKNNNYDVLHGIPILYVGTKELDIGGGSPVQYRGKWYQMYNEHGFESIILIKKIHIESGKDENGEDIEKKCYVTDEELSQEEIASQIGYYKKIMNEINKYPPYYIEQIKKQLNMISIINYDENSKKDWAAYTDKDGYIVLSGNHSEDLYGIGVFNHEIGHIFNNSISRFTNSEEWKEIYRQIKEADPEHKNLRNYAYTNSSECFAEIIAEYYNIDGTADDFYNPDDLKAIRINYKGYTNLYDYIDDIVNGRRRVS